MNASERQFVQSDRDSLRHDLFGSPYLLVDVHSKICDTGSLGRQIREQVINDFSPTAHAMTRFAVRRQLYLGIVPELPVSVTASR